MLSKSTQTLDETFRNSQIWRTYPRKTPRSWRLKKQGPSWSVRKSWNLSSITHEGASKSPRPLEVLNKVQSSRLGIGLDQKSGTHEGRSSERNVAQQGHRIDSHWWKAVSCHRWVNNFGAFEIVSLAPNVWQWFIRRNLIWRHNYYRHYERLIFTREVQFKESDLPSDNNGA